MRLLLACALLAGCTAPDPKLELRTDTGRAEFAVRGLDRSELNALAAEARSVERWRALFAVFVDAGGEVPPLIGRYRVTSDGVAFAPRFPLQPGLSYRAVFDPVQLPSPRRGTVAARTFAIEATPPGPAPVIVAVYPSAVVLPENTLRFYVHFSEPMQQGDVYRHLRLERSDGVAVETPFLEIGEELWDPTGTRLTLLCDPGRVKRGLRPREEDGPILEEGRSYQLIVGADWCSVRGTALGSEHRVAFDVTAPDAQQPAPDRWALEAPTAGERAPLIVRTVQPLDHALMQRMLWVEGPEGRLPGEIEVAAGEAEWRFVPARAWASGHYILVADTALEDPAGNSIRAPFEVDMVGPTQRQLVPATTTRAFEITSAR